LNPPKKSKPAKRKRNCPGAAGDDSSVVQLIRACLKAIVLGRTDFQRYLELIGPGGTGKGTFIRLVQALVGTTNTVSTSLSRIANSRFETSRFVSKRLVFIPDADYNPTAVDTLKQMTGGDHLPLERKNENSDYNDGFTLEGWVLVATNKETIPSDGTNALFRRRIPIYFNRVVPEGDRRCLLDFGPNGVAKGDFLDYLPGLFNWVLALPDELMEAYIKTPVEYVRSIGGFQADSLLNTDSLAGWVEDWVVYEPGAWTQIGNKGQSSKDYLYPSYVTYCEGANIKPVGLPKFSERLKSLLVNQVGLDVRKDRLNNSTGQGFFNIRLRQTKSEPTTEDLYGPTTEVPVEDSPQTVSRALRGQIGGNGEPLCQTDLVRLLNLSCDDPATYQAELARLSPAELDYLYRELPELRPREVSGGA
jgi:putative DNA primase/helicase